MSATASNKFTDADARFARSSGSARAMDDRSNPAIDIARAVAPREARVANGRADARRPARARSHRSHFYIASLDVL
jgi:hypothetical protein